MSDVSTQPRPASAPIGLRKLARGIVWNWSQFLISGVLAFLISPYVVHHLGSSAYGVWILVNSLSAYMAILDLGVRGAVVRFVSSDHAQSRHAAAAESVSAALWFRIWLCALLVVGTGVLALVANRLFQIPPDMQVAARLAIVLAGGSLAITLLFGVFGGVLNALNRFDLLSIAAMGQSVVNYGGVIILLDRGHGIVALAIWQLLIALGAGIFLYLATRRVYPELRVSIRRPSAEVMQRFRSFSVLLFVNALAGQVIYQTDNLVIGAAVSVTAVTSYAIGFAPTQYLRQILSSFGVTFLPAASSLSAQGQYDRLRHLLIQGTRIIMSLALALEVGLLVRGHTFIALWMGPQFAGQSGHVLEVLLISWLFIAGNFCAGNVVYGLSKHRPLAIWAVIEAVVNLGLSVLLVRRWGIIGVAWGTVLPSLVFNAILWPRYITKLLDIPLAGYLLQVWLRPATAMLPFAAACFVAERYWPVHHLAGFFLQMTALAPVGGAGFVLVFRREVAEYLRNSPRWGRLAARRARAS